MGGTGNRHCERSEAIQESWAPYGPLDRRVASLLAMTIPFHRRALRTHFVLGLDEVQNSENETNLSPNETNGFATGVVSH
jgi:hypothetical protein